MYKIVLKISKTYIYKLINIELNSTLIRIRSSGTGYKNINPKEKDQNENKKKKNTERLEHLQRLLKIHISTGFDGKDAITQENIDLLGSEHAVLSREPRSPNPSGIVFSSAAISATSLVDCYGGHRPYALRLDLSRNCLAVAAIDVATVDARHNSRCRRFGAKHRVLIPELVLILQRILFRRV